jgi:ABC-type uncharacterized transport system ATPase subunit
MGERAAIEIRGVFKRYGEITAVAGLDLSVPAGVCFGLLGPNGAGKSTTMRMLTAQTLANQGSIEVLGHELPGESKQARMSMGRPTRKTHRLEPAALAGVMLRDVVHFRRYRKATTFSSIVQPTIYLLAFGLVRDVSLGTFVAADLVHAAVLVSFALVMWRLAIWRLERRLID